MHWTRIFDEARLLAVEKHGAQRYGEKPYAHHLQAVVDVLQRFGATLDDPATAPLLVGAWLHDSIEDTGLTRGEVEDRFGHDVADMVWRVTDAPGATREQRKPLTYPKIRGSEAAIVLKLADRIANVESCRRDSLARFSRYRDEHAEFSRVLRPASSSAMAARLWRHLDGLFEADPA